MQANTTVYLKGIPVNGVKEESGILSFRSIPYATAERWQKAKPSDLDTEGLEAQRFGNVPPQGPPSPFFAQRSGELTELPCSEDCLNICIWTGDNKLKNKPVLLWVYGGAYIAGYNYRKGFTPEELVKAHPDIVVVSPNYRVGVLGSLNLSGLTDDPAYADSNNLALLDIIEAMHWVQKYIGCFGGDPDNVTLYGHSAGSNAISHLLVNPEVKGLFRRAVCQSSFMTDLGTVEYDTSAAIADSFFKAAGVEDLQQALELPIEQLLNAQKTLFRGKYPGKASKLFSPVIDGRTVKADSFAGYANGGIYAESLIIGGSEGEYDQTGWDLSPDEIRAGIIARNSDKHVTVQDIERYISLFPERDETESCLSINNVLGLTMGGEFIARAAAKHIPVYEYQFCLRSDNGVHRALHGDPTYYVFGTLTDKNAPSQLQKQMMDTWVSFMKTGDPNNPQIPDWPRISEQNSVMIIGNSWTPVPEYFSRDYSCWADRFAEANYMNDIKQ